jgi:hypothetical protein
MPTSKLERTLWRVPDRRRPGAVLLRGGEDLVLTGHGALRLPETGAAPLRIALAGVLDSAHGVDRRLIRVELRIVADRSKIAVAGAFGLAGVEVHACAVIRAARHVVDALIGVALRVRVRAARVGRRLPGDRIITASASAPPIRFMAGCLGRTLDVVIAYSVGSAKSS